MRWSWSSFGPKRSWPRAARRARRCGDRPKTIPIVFAHVIDPVGQGLVADLARPTGNVTGFSGFDPIRVCTSYRGLEGAQFDYFPYHQSVLHHSAGEYVELPGWEEDLSECRSVEELPAAARDYLTFLSEFVRVPIALIGVGPGGDEVIWTAEGQSMAGSGQRASAGA